jgi:hypothetical protein
VGIVAYKVLYTPDKSTITMDTYDGSLENRAASNPSRTSPMLAQLTLVEERKRNMYLYEGNMHADIQLQGMFVKERAVYPQDSMTQRSDTMAMQAYVQTLPADRRGLFNINFSRLPSAMGENRPGWNDRISKDRVRL